MNQNTWYKDQERTDKKTFKAKWDVKTIELIIDKLNNMVDFSEIRLFLMTEYSVSPRTAEYWIEIARNVMKDVKNGLSIDEALDRDRERRNMIRRKNKTTS